MALRFKNLHKLASKKSLLATIILTLGATNPAFSLEMQASTEWTLNNGTTPSQDIDGPASTGYVDVLSSANSDGNSVFYHTFGNDTGHFGSRTSGEGSFNISGLYTFQENYTANGGNATFDFNAISGEIATFAGGHEFGTNEEVYASYSLNIFLNDSSIWNSSAEILQNASGVSLLNAGTSIGGTQSGSQYSWNNYSEMLDLGSFSAGELVNIRYELATSAHSNISFALDQCNFSELALDDFLVETGGGDDDDGIGDFGGENCRSVSAIARIGDPINFNNPSNSLIISGASPTASTVPAPSVISLLALGLVGLQVSRKTVRA